MNKISWNDIRQTLKDDAAARPVPPAAPFWEEFRARARMTPQWQVSHSPASVSLIFKRVALSTCATLLLAALSLYWLSGLPARATQIQSVEVIASHSAVLIMDDNSEDGTLLWVVDMHSPTPHVTDENGDNG